MATYYYFYDPDTMKQIESGKYDFYDILEGNDNLKKYAIEKCDFYDGFCIPALVGILDRKTAENLQNQMGDGFSLFTDLMDKCHSECIIYKIE